MVAILGKQLPDKVTLENPALDLRATTEIQLAQLIQLARAKSPAGQPSLKPSSSQLVRRSFQLARALIYKGRAGELGYSARVSCGIKRRRCNIIVTEL